MENTVSPFSFNFGDTETIDLENALTAHLGGEDIQIEKKEQEIKPPALQKSKEDDKEIPVTISDEELAKELLLKTFEEKEEESEEKKEDEPVIEASDAEQLGKDFYRLGILTGDELEIKTDEQLLEALEFESDKKAEDKINGFITSKGEKAVSWFKACIVDGIDPEEYFSISKNIESVKEVDMEDVNVQRSLVRRLLTERSNFTLEKAEKYIKILEADGDLDKEAISAQEQFLAAEEKLLLQKAEAKEKEQKYKLHEAAQYENNVHAKLSEVLKSKDLSGLPVTDKIANTTLSYMTQKNWKLKNGDPISDFDKFLLELRQPENIETALKVALLAQNNFDFSKIKQKALSEKTDKLFTKLTKKETEEKRDQPFKDQFKIEI